MLKKYKYLIFACALVASSSWWFKARNQSAYVTYTKNDYDNDCSEIYYDLGISAMARNDYIQARQSFLSVLTHKPNHLKAQHQLDICSTHINNTKQSSRH